MSSLNVWLSKVSWGQWRLIVEFRLDTDLTAEQLGWAEPSITPTDVPQFQMTLIKKSCLVSWCFRGLTLTLACNHDEPEAERETMWNQNWSLNVKERIEKSSSDKHGDRKRVVVSVRPEQV